MTKVNPLLETQVIAPPTDSISDLSFSKVGNLLAASSWSNQVEIWGVRSDGTSTPLNAYSHAGPALTVDWSADSTKVASGGADNAGWILDVTTCRTSQFAQHECPIKGVRWIGDGPDVVATGSWDKTIKYWDLRQRTSVATIDLSDRLYSMDAGNSMLVAATADRQITLFHVGGTGGGSFSTMPLVKVESPLKMQTRVVSCFSHGEGFAVGSIEGRVGINHAQPRDRRNNFSFKCHRRENEPYRQDTTVFAINAIEFHPIYGTFATAGGDGTVTFWDKDARQRLKTFGGSIDGPISAAAFNWNGSIFAYAKSYDWSKGYHGAKSGGNNTIILRSVTDDDIKPNRFPR